MTRQETTVTRISNAELQQNLWVLFSKPREPMLTRETTALLCVDLQYYDAHRGYGLGAKAKRLGVPDFLEGYWERLERMVIPNVNKLQESARARGLEVIHVRVATITRDGRDNTVRYKTMGSGSPHNTKDAEFIPEVAPQGDEIVISKVTSSAFNSTNIDRILRNVGIENLIVVGVVTNGCVESTVRSAAELDYGVYLVEDATAAMAPQLHEHSILSMSYKDAAIKSTDEILRMLSDIAPLPKEGDAELARREKVATIARP
jgi:nicotinamidase-related amidase